MSKYYSINEFSKILGVSAQTLRNWDNNGKLHPHHTSSNGYRYYSHEQLNQVMNIKPNLDRIVIGYCRVSSNKQKDDLEGLLFTYFVEYQLEFNQNPRLSDTQCFFIDIKGSILCFVK